MQSGKPCQTVPQWPTRFPCFWVILAVLAVAFVCPSASRAQDWSGDAIRIGVLSDYSGIYQDLGGEGSAVAAEMALADWRAAGGTLGTDIPIEILRGDHQNSVEQGIDLISGWRHQAQGLDAVVDVPNSAVALAVQQIARRSGLIHLNVSAAAPELTGAACAETGFSWVFSTTALANSLGHAVVSQGYKDWFFVTADYVFGHRLEADTISAVFLAGGQIRGVTRHPFGHTDFTDALTQARASGASVIALANAGQDMVNGVETAVRMDLAAGTQAPRLVGLLTFLSEVHKLGAEKAQGLMLVTGWYWNRTDQTRAFAERFYARMERMPTMTHAAVYSAVGHYLKALEQAGTDDGPTVAQVMKSLPVNDVFTDTGRLLANGRLLHDLYLAQVKSPKDMVHKWDYYQILGTVSGETAFPSQAREHCLLGKMTTD